MKLILLIGLIGVLALSGCTAGSAHPQTPAFASFAQCITDSGTVMYGSFTCLSCKKQREGFGDTFQFIQEIECHPNGENPQVQLCLDTKIEKTPTWVREVDGVETGRLVGFQSYEELSRLSGCAYPGPQ
ncbi:MAG: hypothetical protein AABW68_01025 [archaeon]